MGFFSLFFSPVELLFSMWAALLQISVFCLLFRCLGVWRSTALALESAPVHSGASAALAVMPAQCGSRDVEYSILWGAGCIRVERAWALGILCPLLTAVSLTSLSTGAMIAAIAVILLAMRINVPVRLACCLKVVRFRSQLRTAQGRPRKLGER